MWSEIATAAEGARLHTGLNAAARVDAVAQYLSITRTAVQKLEAVFADRLDVDVRIDIKEALFDASESLRLSMAPTATGNELAEAVGHIDQINSAMAQQTARIVGEDVRQFRKRFGLRLYFKFFRRYPKFLSALRELQKFDYEGVTHRASFVELWRTPLLEVYRQYVALGGTRLLDIQSGWLTERARGLEVFWITIMLSGFVALHILLIYVVPV